uniref:Uncharacterized protein n=1 Tax=Avena sativa TaxID=4498 RepID=A0ACD5YHL3_AVESA
MATTGSSRRRVFAPDSPTNWVNVPVGKQRDADTSLLLAKIKAFYREAQRRLIVKVRPATAARLLSAGYCFGLLDPISNILVNTLSASSGPIPDDQREALLKGGVVRGKRLQDAQTRSLDGLITFLTCFFPYLEEWEAVRYLLLADADPLLAARLVVHDRGLKRFDFSSGATAAALRMSLKCAALCAKHPEPDQLVGAWMALSPRLDQRAVSELSAARLVTLGRLRGLTKLVSPSSPEAPDLMRRCWELVACRLQGRGDDDVSGKAVAFQHRRSLRRTLLDTIHGFYLRAFARLPAGELRSKYHRSLLDAGHCYGPMDDPVSNILLNTVWYDAAAFPPNSEEELDMGDAAATAQSLLRIAARSLYGLLSFLGTRYPDLEYPDAIRCLLSADADLGAAATEAERLGHRPRCTVREAYAAAAAAAWHPQPDAQAQRLSSCGTDTISIASSLLQNGGPLVSSQDLMRLGSLLISPKPGDVPPQRQPASVVPRPPQDGRIYAKVKAALTRYSLQVIDRPMYEVHVICGVNERVSGPELRVKQKWNGCLPYFFHYYRTHVNFLASAAAGADGPAPAAPVLFFAELSNDQDDETACCQPVSAPPPCAGHLPRCLYCDHEASGIVHPAVEEFHGRQLEFEKMVCREDMFDDEFDPDHEDQHFTNYDIIEESEYIAEWVEEGCYYDSLEDSGCECDDDDDD